MNETLRMEIINVFASNMAVVITAGVCIASLIFDIMIYRRDKKESSVLHNVCGRNRG